MVQFLVLSLVLACRELARLASFGLLGLVWRERRARSDCLGRRLVEFLGFNLLALVCFELARLSLFFGLLAYFILVWFVGLEGLFCF